MVLENYKTIIMFPNNNYKTELNKRSYGNCKLLNSINGQTYIFIQNYLRYKEECLESNKIITQTGLCLKYGYPKDTFNGNHYKEWFDLFEAIDTVRLDINEEAVQSYHKGMSPMASLIVKNNRTYRSEQEETNIERIKATNKKTIAETKLIEARLKLIELELSKESPDLEIVKILVD